MPLLGWYLWGGMGTCGVSAGPSLAVLIAQARPGLQQLFFCYLISNKALFLPTALWGKKSVSRPLQNGSAVC